ncbi:MAG: metalloregulator ArsR/SmtB family transcription factor [Beijerinckiaceae bacterium]|nr:metalloregulator ArsR/SmtB family transcription factor [Beijerinckiaceae bacterium]
MGLDPMVAALRAAGEDTRLRLLALLAEGELSVSDLTDILGQSQPRISRHLKLMVEAGLLVRHREGAWAFFALAAQGPGADIARALIAALDHDDRVLAADRQRLKAVRDARSEAAQSYFARHAADWDRIRSLHVSDDVVEAAILKAIGPAPLGAVLDLGTGTGRMLQLLSDRAERLVGVDASHAMLAVARAHLAEAGLRAELRQCDVYALPFEMKGFDLIVLHQVLHFLDDPARVLREAALRLKPGGRLLVVDFAPHAHEFLRSEQAHRRLGFSATQLDSWFREAGLEPLLHRDLAPEASERDHLTVSLFMARDPRPALSRDTREIA